MTDEIIQKLWNQYRVPLHIRAHMEKVAEVCIFLSKKMQQAGENVDLEKLRHAALLHDILKLCDFQKLDLTRFTQTYTAEDVHFWSSLIRACGRIGHIHAAYNMLKEIHEDEIAEIVKKHEYRCLVQPGRCPATLEEKILYYADKRVLHDRIVGLSERVADGRKRYFPDGNFPDEDKLIERALYNLEKELCKKAGIGPEDINETII